MDSVQKRFIVVLIFCSFVNGIDGVKCYNCDSINNDRCARLLNPSIGNNKGRHCYQQVIKGENFVITRSHNKFEGAIECNGAFCNNVMVQTTLRCIVCETDTMDRRCFEEQFARRYNTGCKPIDENTKCFVYYDESKPKSLVRGCMNTDDKYFILCNEHPERCHICNDTLCNYMAYPHNLRLACATCSEKNPACSLDYIYNPKFTGCLEHTGSRYGDQCFKYVFPNARTKYGCLTDETQFCKNHSCSLCHESMCNAVVHGPQLCLQCNSSKDHLCAGSPHRIPGTHCDYDNDYSLVGCFVRWYRSRQGDRIVERGCVTSLNLTGIRECLFDYSVRKTSCFRCTGQNCNRDILPFGL